MENEQLMEVSTNEILKNALVAKPVESEEIKAQEGEEELGPYEHGKPAETFGYELVNEEIFHSKTESLIKINEYKTNNLKDRDLEQGVEEEKQEEKNETFSKSELADAAQTEQVLEAPEGFKIIYNPEVWDKIRTWVEMTTEEISGMGCVRREKDGSFYVYDVFLLKQENTGSFTDIDDEALMELMWELQQLDDEDGGTRYDDLKYWWHSHANMGTFWSGQDERCIQQKLGHANWWLSTVHNRKGDCTTRYDIANPPTRFDNLKLELSREVSQEIKEFCRKEYEEKVTEKRYTRTVTTYSNGSNFPRPYGQHWQNQNRYQGNQTSAQATSQTAAKTTATGTARARQLPAKTQTQAQAEQKTKITQAKTIKTLEYAAIVSTTDNPRLFQGTPAIARELYKDQILIGQMYLNERLKGLTVGNVKLTGLAYNPRAASAPSTGVEWTVTGSVTLKSNVKESNTCYMLVVWHDEPECVAITQVSGIRHRSEDGLVVPGRSISVPDNKFVNLSLDCSPDVIVLGSSGHPNDLEVCVGIIFQTSFPLSPLLFGQDFIDTEEEELDNVVDISSVTEESPEEQTEKDENEEIAQEVMLFDQLVAYAEGANHLALEERILSTLKTATKDTLSDALGLLAGNMAKDADEQSLEEEAEHMTEDVLLKHIEMFAKRNAKEAFPYVWSVLPYMYICPQCFEPTTAEAMKCPNCKEDLPEVEE